MSAFDKIIGYEAVKKELKQLCDIIHNMDVYKRMGAKMPKGLLLDGAPGLGKTLMAQALIEESGVSSFILRRSKGDGDFIREIEATFDKAIESAPAIILLDDLDKFAKSDDSDEEFSVVQACIDKVKAADVFVIATTNKSNSFPHSLIRSGRFDRHLKICSPTGEEARQIISYYLEDKPLVDDVNVDDVSKMLRGSSCAKLETVINEAAVHAAYERCDKIKMEHIIKATLRDMYNSLIDDPLSERELREVAYHEAGHAVITEIIKEGSVGMVSINTNKSSTSGFVHKCKELERRPHQILATLGGKAGAELKFGRVASGTRTDLSRATYLIEEGLTETGTMGNYVLAAGGCSQSPTTLANIELLVHAKLDEFLLKAKELLCSNMGFFTEIAEQLLEKQVLLASDVKRIRQKHTIVGIDML